MPDRIRLRGVTKRYGAVTALEDVDLTVRPGEFHCVVGPNGSGKTTLFALALGLTRPTAGTVDRPSGTVGCSFQRPTCYPDLTVAENLRVFARLSGCPDEAWRRSVVERFGLDRVGDRLAGDLSGGWQQQLDLALAFVKRPTVALLDEPFGDLDDVSKRRLRAFLAEYCDEDRTVVAATHHVDAFEPVVDRLTVFDRGRIQYDGPVGSDESARDLYLSVVE